MNETTLAILSLLALGAYHGLNPGMGWLFAVALGLQERRRQAVLRAFAPIALGHALSIGVVVLLFGLIQAFLPDRALNWGCAILLIGFGTYKLVRHRHPRWVGMQVNFTDLTLWSFLMATAHGAGLMILPVLLNWSGNPDAANAADHAEHIHAVDQAASAEIIAASVALHTAALFFVMAGVALIVYEKVGLNILRTAWFNVDLIWAVALIVAGVVALII